MDVQHGHCAPSAFTDSSILIRFGLLFSALYLAFGTASPFLPLFLSSRGLGPEQIGLVLALSTAIRLVSGPAAGWIADRLQALRIVLAICLTVAAMAAVWFGMAHGFLTLLTVGLLHAAMLAPTTTLADALALGAVRSSRASRGRFEYGWVRGAGSAAFILGSIASGQLVTSLGPAAALTLQAILLAAAAGAALFVPELGRPGFGQARISPPAIHVLDLGRIPNFRRVVLVATIILGSHAMHDSFVMIRWDSVGISAAVGSILWAESVAAEVVVFVGLGPFLLRRIKPEVAMTIAVVAAVVRWAVIAQVTDVAAFALIEPLHGLTFALLHLSCMRILVLIVPPTLAATAQAVYATGIGAASAVLTLLSGWLYSQFSSGGFWAMAVLAALALPVIWALHRSTPTAQATDG